MMYRENVGWNSNAFVYGALGLAWLLLVIVSVNHIYSIIYIPYLSVAVLGLMSWGVIILTILLLSRYYLRQALVVFLLFFSFGVWFGPFLEPPADTFAHLQRTHSYCEKNADELPKKNLGFWHYSMSAVMLCGDSNSQDTDITILKLDTLHGIYQGILITVLFVLAKSAGLPDRWAFLSCCICFLFFGTNRFSYFSYYSFAPTYSSMLIYWLWVALFFFRKNWVAILSGFLSALLLVPILWVNHIQEVFLLALVVFVWLTLNAHERIWSRFDSKIVSKVAVSLGGKILPRSLVWSKNYWNRIFRFVYVGCVFCLLFIVPQWKYFQESFAKLFLRDFWATNQSVVFTWNDWHLFGKIWTIRVNDTFSWVGLLLMVLAVPFFYSGWIRKANATKIRVFLLSILPFVGYFIPLVHFTWLSNVKIPEYYRLCYSSMFWLFFAYFLWGMEGRIVLAIKIIRRRWLRWV